MNIPATTTIIVDDFIALGQIRTNAKMATVYLTHITHLRRLNQEGDDRLFDAICLYMQCLRRIWDQTIAAHSEAKKLNREASFPWKIIQERTHSEAFMQDLASAQAYKGSIWDAMRWALPSVET